MDAAKMSGVLHSPKMYNIQIHISTWKRNEYITKRLACGENEKKRIPRRQKGDCLRCSNVWLTHDANHDSVSI